MQKWNSGFQRDKPYPTWWVAFQQQGVYPTSACRVKAGEGKTWAHEFSQSGEKREGDFPCQGPVTEGTDNPQEIFTEHFHDSPDMILKTAGQGESLECVKKGSI